MKIISLNIWGGNKKEALLDFFKKYSISTDIFCLQEVLDNAKTERLIYKDENMNIFNDIQHMLPDFKGHFHASEGKEKDSPFL